MKKLMKSKSRDFIIIKISQLLRWYRLLKYSILLKKNLFKKNIMFANKPRISRKNDIQFNGRDVYIGFDCHIGANVILGSKILIASNVSFIGGDHRFDRVGMYMIDCGREEQLKNIVIANDVWIGHGATILQGVTIHNGAIVAAGSVVTKDVAPFSIVAGCPAKKVKDRFSLEEIDKHQKILKFQ